MGNRPQANAVSVTIRIIRSEVRMITILVGMASWY